MEHVRWGKIEGFPTYAVSDHGHILNMKTDHLVRISYTMQGNAKVSLDAPRAVDAPRSRSTLSVARLVALAFVEPPNPFCTHVIVLNGNMADLRAENLAWRPSSFAWRYTRQMREGQPGYFYSLQLMDITTDLMYQNVVSAGQELGLLFADIWRSTYTGESVYPTQSIFRVVG